MKIIYDIKPDIIHIHGTENPFACIIDEIDIPIVVSIQGNISIYHHKYFAGIEKRFLSIKKDAKSFRELIFSKSFSFGFKSFALKKEIELRNLKKVSYIIGRTDWDKRITSIMAPNSIYFHCDEILRDCFYENDEFVFHKKRKIVLHTTSGDSFYKGFETLCQALYELNKININVEWRVAGISEKSLIYKIVRKKLGKNFPKKGLVLLGSLSETELILALKEANIYIMTSHIENSPNNLCEAMILGMPCIATFAGGTASILENNKEGILIQDGDPWSMAGTILELMNNWNQAVELGKNAKERAKKRHDKNKIVNELLNIYNTLISKKINKDYNLIL